MKKIMKKLIFVMFITTLSYDNFYAMEINQNNIAHIKGTLAILHHNQELFYIEEQTQAHRLKDQDDLISKIHNFQTHIKQEEYGIKSYDFLIDNQDLLQTANIPNESPFYSFLLLSKEYLASHQVMTPSHQHAVLHKIKSLVPYHQNMFDDEIQQYHCKKLHDVAQYTKAVYEKAWNIHKSAIINQLNQHATMAIMNKHQSALQQFHAQRAQAALAGYIEQYDRTLLCMYQQMYEPKINVTEDCPTSENITTCACIEKTEIAAQTGVENILNASKKALLKKKAAAQAAAQRSRQSRIDKERHRAHVEQEEKKRAEIMQSLPATLVEETGVVSSLSPKKSSSKKTKKKNSRQPVIDEDNAFLDAIIAENSHTIVQKQETFFKQACEFEKNKSLDDSKESKKLSRQSIDLIQYVDFINARNETMKKFQHDKNQETIENLKKVARAKAEDRESLKIKLKLATHNKYEMIIKSLHQDEMKYLLLFYEYAELLNRSNVNEIPIENFMQIEQKIVDLNNDSIQNGTPLKWYLMSYKNLYNTIKDRYKNIQRNVNKATSNSSYILQKLSMIHTQEGVLDLSRLIYTVKNHEELDALGTLPATVLEQAQQDIQSLFKDQTGELTYGLIKPIIDNLMQQAFINDLTSEIVDDMINMSAAIACLDTPQDNKEKLFTEIYVMIFYSLQRKNELSCSPLTDNQMADITKINMAVLRALIDLIQV